MTVQIREDTVIVYYDEPDTPRVSFLRQAPDDSTSWYRYTPSRGLIRLLGKVVRRYVEWGYGRGVYPDNTGDIGWHFSRMRTRERIGDRVQRR